MWGIYKNDRPWKTHSSGIRLTSKSRTEPLETQQPGNPRDADPIKDCLRPSQLKYLLNRPVNDRCSCYKRQIAHCVGIGVAPSAAQAELSDVIPNVFKYLTAN